MKPNYRVPRLPNTPPLLTDDERSHMIEHGEHKQYMLPDIHRSLFRIVIIVALLCFLMGSYGLLMKYLDLL